VVIDDLHVVSIPFLPDKADAKLIVDPNAVLPQPIAGEGFQPVAWERRQVAQLARSMELLQFSLGDSSDLLEPAGELARKERLRFAIFE